MLSRLAVNATTMAFGFPHTSNSDMARILNVNKTKSNADTPGSDFASRPDNGLAGVKISLLAIRHQSRPTSGNQCTWTRSGH
jgi:hypothetical protein